MLEKEGPLLVVEHMAGGDLKRLLVQRREQLGPRDRLNYAFQIASALSYLHSCSIIHGTFGLHVSFGQRLWHRMTRPLSTLASGSELNDGSAPQEMFAQRTSCVAKMAKPFAWLTLVRRG